MPTNTHIVSLVHVGAAGKQVPHHLYGAIACSMVKRRLTILQVSTNTPERQSFEAFDLFITNEVCATILRTQWLDSVCARV